MSKTYLATLWLSTKVQQRLPNMHMMHLATAMDLGHAWGIGIKNNRLIFNMDSSALIGWGMYFSISLDDLFK